MKLELQRENENLIVPPMTEELLSKLKDAQFERSVRDNRLAGLRSITGVTNIQPVVKRAEIKAFMNSVTTDYELAIETLIVNSITRPNSEKSVSYQLLSKLKRNTYLTEYNEEEWIALFFLLADTADEMSKILGAVAPSSYRIVDICEELSERILRYITPEKRADSILNSIKNGKASSFVINFVLHTLQKHREMDTKFEYFIPWLKPAKLEKIRLETLKRVKKIVNGGIKGFVDPLCLFLFWYEFDDDSNRKELREWIRENTKSDENFVFFISLFSEKARIVESLIQSKIVWVVYTNILENVTGDISFLKRLKQISVNDSRLGEIAKELLSRIEIERKAKERGLRVRKYFENG